MTANDQALSALQKTISESGGGWVAAPTTMSTLSQADQKIRLGVPLPAEQEITAILGRGKALGAVPHAAAGAPTSWDYRNVSGQSYVTPIKDQGGCGSCVAFGSCAAIETSFRWQRRSPSMAIDLSEAHLFYCYARAEGQNCNTGWWPDHALSHAQNDGVVDEACFPYTAGDQACNLCSGWQSRLTKISGFTDLTNNAAGMKEWLAANGALTACFIVYNDFFSYSSGVYRHVSGGQAGGHCIAIIGYDDAQGCWICKNSWGTGWGDGGFFRIAYGECGIETWMVHGVNSVVETGWISNTRVLGLWANNAERNAYVYLDGTGWRRIAYDNDAIFIAMLTQLAAARVANRPVNCYQENAVIKQAYVF